jgi:hypothetical protein
MSANRVSLPYAPPTRVRWYRRRSVRRAFITAFALALILGSWRGSIAWHGEPGQWARFRYWYWVCARHAEAPARIVYAHNDPAARAAMLRDTGVQLGSGTNNPDVFLAAPQLRKFLEASSIGPMPPLSTCFLHERQSKKGECKLISIEQGPEGDVDNFWVSVFSPRFDQRGQGTGMAYGTIVHPGGDLRVYAGQPDPNDPAHFTIRYTSNGEAGTIDGRLDADGNVSLTSIGPMKIIDVEPVSLD